MVAIVHSPHFDLSARMRAPYSDFCPLRLRPLTSRSSTFPGGFFPGCFFLGGHFSNRQSLAGIEGLDQLHEFGHQQFNVFFSASCGHDRLLVLTAIAAPKKW
jgi:hypothetical protein